MAWNGSGSFSRTNGTYTGTTVWQQDAAADVDIEADRHDTHDQDLAAGINACLAKNGENAMTGNLNMGSNDITNADSISGTSGTFSGTVEAGAITIGGTPIAEELNADLGIGSVTQYDTPQDAIDALDAVYFPAGTYANAALDIESIRVTGDGVVSDLAQGFTVQDTVTGAHTIDIREIGGAATGAFVGSEQAGAADLTVRIRDLDVDAAGSAVSLRNSGIITGHISGIRATDLTSLGINVGWNDYAASADWGPVLISDNIIDGVAPGDANSHYGILTYAPYSIVNGNFVRNINATDSGDNEGIYTKARHSVVAANVLIDAGTGEGFMNIKGDKRGETSDPQGFGIVATGNVFYATDSYASGDATSGAVKIATDDVIFSDALIDNMPGAGIVSLADELDNVMIDSVLIARGDCAEGGIYLPNSGKVTSVRGVTIRDVSANAIRLQGQTAATEIEISDCNVDGAGNFGILLRPGADSVAQYRLSNVRFRNIAGAAVIKFEAFDALSVVLNDVDVGSHATPLGYAAGIETNAWSVRNLHGTRQTTDATATTIFKMRVPTNKPMMLTARVIGSDGTDTYVIEKRAAYFNAAGTVSLVGSASDTFAAESAGASAWEATFVISGADVDVNVTGEAAHTINWRVLIDADTP